MTVLLEVADLFRLFLVPFLIVAGVVLTGLFAIVVVQHGVREVLFRRRRTLTLLYQPLIDQLLVDGNDAARVRLEHSPRRHRRVVAQLLTTATRTLEGATVERGRLLSVALDLPAMWRRDLGDRRWWFRAEAARALGTLADAGCFDVLVAALDDPHDEVRAAGIQALGRLGDKRAIPELVTRLPEQSRHQRTRVVDSLCLLGAQGSAEVLAFTREHPDVLPLVWEMVSRTAGAAAMTDLLGWTSDERPSVRAAALGSIAAIGVDDRAFYYAVRGVTDDAPEVRAMAARALGRSRRADAAEYLAAHLNDDWQVAAEAARGLAALGPPGRAELDRAAAVDGQGGDLAKQIVWELNSRVATTPRTPAWRSAGATP